MIHAGRKSRPYGLGCRARGSHPVLLPMIAPASLAWSGRLHRLGTWNVRLINGTEKREEVGLFLEKES